MHSAKNEYKTNEENSGLKRYLHCLSSRKRHGVTQQNCSPQLENLVPLDISVCEEITIRPSVQKTMIQIALARSSQSRTREHEQLCLPCLLFFFSFEPTGRQKSDLIWPNLNDLICSIERGSNCQTVILPILIPVPGDRQLAKHPFNVRNLSFSPRYKQTVGSKALRIWSCYCSCLTWCAWLCVCVLHVFHSTSPKKVVHSTRSTKLRVGWWWRWWCGFSLFIC